MSAIRRITTLTRPPRGRLALAVLLGVLALGSGIGLLATSAWLISRAAQHPPVLLLMVAIVAVRAFGIGRGVFRYAERLVSHDATFRILADLRAKVYVCLERLSPATLPAFRRGDLLGRFVADVDTVQDFYLRTLLPSAVAVVVGGASVGLAWALLPSAGAILLVTLLAAGVLAPRLSARLARRAERRTADVRGELTAHVVDTLQGVPELVAYGVISERLAEARRLDAELTRASARSATTVGLGSAIAALAGGLAVWGGLAVGVPAVRSGHLDGVLLAVVVLLPLAAFEVVAGLPLAAQYLEQVRRSGLHRPRPGAASRRSGPSGGAATAAVRPRRQGPAGPLDTRRTGRARRAVAHPGARTAVRRCRAERGRQVDTRRRAAALPRPKRWPGDAWRRRSQAAGR